MTRPKLLTPVTLTIVMLHLIRSAAFFAPDWQIRAILIGLAVLVGVLLWFFWRGHNWMRWIVMGVAVITVVPTIVEFTVALFDSETVHPAVAVYYVHPALAFYYYAELALGIFLLYWLNTKNVREFFTGFDVEAS